MRKILAAFLALALSILPACAQNPSFPQILPQGTFIGRSAGAGTGPAAALPFSNFTPSFKTNPWADVLAYGAKGDGSTDDTGAVQNAVAAIQALGGGAVYFPTGFTYCAKTGPVTTTANGTRLIAESVSAVLSACGNNVTVVDLNGFKDTIENLQVLGFDSTSGTQSAIIVDTNCTECILYNDWVQFGAPSVLVKAADVILFADKVQQSYSTQVKLNAGQGKANYLIRDKLDQQFPGTTPNYGFAPGSWSNSACTANAIISVNGYWLQCTTPGSGGASAPPLPYTYSSPIVDGSAQWKLVKNASAFYSVYTQNSGEVFMWGNDHTGAFDASVYLDVGSNFTMIEAATLGDPFIAGVEAHSGHDLYVLGSSFFGCLQTGCSGLQLDSGGTWTGNVIATGNAFTNLGTGISLNGGGKSLFTSNLIYSNNVQGISVAAAVTDFLINDNIIENNTGNAITIAAGASDWYDVIGNIVHGATVSDGGTGTHKTLTGNN